jgi:hypothetical protein
MPCGTAGRNETQCKVTFVSAIRTLQKILHLVVFVYSANKRELKDLAIHISGKL